MSNPPKGRSRQHYLQAFLRDAWLLLRQFRWSLLLFFGVWFGSAFGLYLAYPLQSLDWLESLYSSLMLIFLNPTLEFPESGWTRLIFFWTPIAGAFVFTVAVIQFGTALFVKAYREEEWQTVIASTYKDHVIVIGLGRIGYRTVNELLDIHEDVVAILGDASADSLLVKRLKARGVPVLSEDPRHHEGLNDAQIAGAKALILCTDDDLMNIEIALAARSLNPQLRIVARLFNDDLAREVAQLRIDAIISSSALAAPALVSAASTKAIMHTIPVGNQLMHFAQINVHPRGRLAGKSVSELEETFRLSIVLRKSENGQMDQHPPGNIQIHSGDMLILLAPLENLSRLNKENGGEF